MLLHHFFLSYISFDLNSKGQVIAQLKLFYFILFKKKGENSVYFPFFCFFFSQNEGSCPSKYCGQKEKKRKKKKRKRRRRGGGRKLGSIGERMSAQASTLFTLVICFSSVTEHVPPSFECFFVMTRWSRICLVGERHRPLCVPRQLAVLDENRPSHPPPIFLPFPFFLFLFSSGEKKICHSR